MYRSQNRNVKSKVKLTQEQASKYSEFENKVLELWGVEKRPDSMVCAKRIENVFPEVKKAKLKNETVLKRLKSSSSSLSWEDELDNASTDLVRNEYERMLRILEGREKIPKNYNQQEYLQWMTTFPQLSLTGRQIVPENFPGYGKIKSSYENIKSNIVDEIFQNVTDKLLSDAKYENEQKSVDKSTETPIRTKESLLHYKTPQLLRRANHVHGVDPGEVPNAVARSDIVSSKWLSTGDFSLPFISVNQCNSAVSSKQNYKKRNKDAKLQQGVWDKSNKKQSNCQKHVILPPIDLKVPDSQFRSFSATPNFDFAKKFGDNSVKTKKQFFM